MLGLALLPAHYLVLLSLPLNHRLYRTAVTAVMAHSRRVFLSVLLGRAWTPRLL